MQWNTYRAKPMDHLKHQLNAFICLSTVSCKCQQKYASIWNWTCTNRMAKLLNPWLLTFRKLFLSILKSHVCKVPWSLGAHLPYYLLHTDLCYNCCSTISSTRHLADAARHLPLEERTCRRIESCRLLHFHDCISNPLDSHPPVLGASDQPKRAHHYAKSTSNARPTRYCSASLVGENEICTTCQLLSLKRTPGELGNILPHA